MTECQCVNVVITNPTFVICACHQRLGLLHRVNCECLVVDMFECAINHRILLTTRFQYASIQIDVLYTCSLAVDYNITRYTLGSIVYHVFLIHQAIHLGSKSNEFHDAMTIVFVLENRSWQFLVEV